MQRGIIWCPHCGGPHALGTTVCPKTAKSLDRSTQKDPEHPLIGSVIGGKYLVTKVIGVGGMGTVFEAQNRLLKRLVAIKLVDKLSATAEAAARLEREAHLIAAVQHPNICDLYDVGVMSDASPYLVLERLFGETLRDSLKRSRYLDAGLAFDLFTQLLSGLQAAHGANVIHRDLKPANIFLVDRLGCAPLVKIVDFGFAKDISGVRVRAMTHPNMLMGTIKYMSPEVLDRQAVDRRTDVFGVGLIMYEALTGELPFADPMTKGDVPPGKVAKALRTARPDLPLDVGDVVACALARDPQARYASAADFQVALSKAFGRCIVDSEPPPSSTTGP